MWRLFAVWFSIEDNISHLLLTEFRTIYPYETLELCLFALLGLTCGILSFLFVQLQRTIVLVNRRKNCLSAFLNRFPLIYPLLISFVIASLKYPAGIGQFTSSYMTMEKSMHELYSNFTWYGIREQDDNQTDPVVQHILHTWSSHHTSIFVNTFLFFVSNFLTIALASTVPVPGGLIVPLFMLGAGLGRFFGEWAAFLFPFGISGTEFENVIQPGAYAVAASAALCGGVTGSLSVAVIAFEITGQLTHFLPIIVCVLCSNLVARHLGPTTYESTIELKNLPFLPTMIKASTVSHRVLVEDFMDQEVQFLWNGCTYQTLHDIIHSANLLAFYPFVSSPDSRYLLGIVHHLEIKALLETHFNTAGLKGIRDDTISKSDSNINGRFQIDKIWSTPYRSTVSKVGLEIRLSSSRNMFVLFLITRSDRKNYGSKR